MDAAGADGASAAPRADRRPIPAPAVGLAVALVVGSLHRWARNGAPPLVWNDTADYVASSKTALWSLDRWAGARPPLMPLLLSVAGGSFERFASYQTWLAALSWGVLGAAVAAALGTSPRRVVAAVVVVVVAVPWPVAMWDQEVLTESLALSGLALVVAAGVRFAEGATPWRIAGLVAACGWWLAVRDSHVVPVACLAVALAVAAWRGWLRPRPEALATACLLLALAVLVVGAADAGGRDKLPLEHVYAVRVLPYPNRVSWFADHGMPDGPALAAIPPAQAPGLAPYTPIPPDPRWARWRSWLADHGRSALLRYAVTHPAFVVREPLRDPERVFNNSGGLAGYRPLELRHYPLADALGYPPTWAAVVAGVVALAAAIRRRVATSPLAVAGLVTIATAAPHALVVWHSDGMESARHLLIPGVQLRLGVVLLALAAALAPTPSPEPEPEPEPEPVVEPLPDEALSA
jgi:hypothetical protein